jgi:hypothetical protein
MNLVKSWILYSFNKDKAYEIVFEVLNVKQRHFAIKVIVNFVFAMI